MFSGHTLEKCIFSIVAVYDECLQREVLLCEKGARCFNRTVV